MFISNILGKTSIALFIYKFPESFSAKRAYDKAKKGKKLRLALKNLRFWGKV